MISPAQANVVLGLIDSEPFLEIMRDLQEDLFSMWCGETDTEERAQIYAEMKGIESIWNKINSLAYELKQRGDTE